MCPKNPNRQEHPRGATGKTPWNKGQTASTNAQIATAVNKVKNYWIDKPGSFTGKKHNEESRQRISETMKRRYADGTRDVYCGRAKKYHYTSHIAGDVVLDGTWEVTVAKWFDAQQVIWKRNRTRFPYVHLNGKISTYLPDFVLEETNTYIEVKGYETKLDQCKWSQFPHKLTVLRRADIQKDRKSVG
jgi:hypothetical protein